MTPNHLEPVLLGELPPTDETTVLGAEPPAELAPAPEPLPPGAAVSQAVQYAIAALHAQSPLHGEEVVHGLIDALARHIARSPHTQTIRDRRLYVDEIRDAVLAQVNAYQAAKVVEIPERPKLVLLPGLGGDAA
jgi:hypothetical protein